MSYFSYRLRFYWLDSYHVSAKGNMLSPKLLNSFLDAQKVAWGELQNKYLYLNPNTSLSLIFYIIIHMTRREQDSRAGNHKDLGKSRRQNEGQDMNQEQEIKDSVLISIPLSSNWVLTGWNEITILTSLLVVTESQCSLRTLQLYWAPLELSLKQETQFSVLL